MRITNLTRVASRAPLTLLTLAALVACSSSPKDGPAGADAGSSSPPPAPPDVGPTGTNCQDITQTYSICAELSTCPGLLIDPYTFPQCGFAVHGDVIDPECLCFGSMCPMGVPGTCADMAAILASTTASAICQQYTAGHCQNLGGQKSAAQCQVCRQTCGSDPTCIHNCGC